MSNILPHDYKAKVWKLRALRLIIVIIFAVTSLGAAGLLLLIPTLMTVDSRYSIANSQVKRLEDAGAIADPARVSSLGARTGVLVQKLASTLAVPPSDHLAVVRERTVSGITLTGFTMTDASSLSATVSGIALNRQSLQNFVTSLANDERVAVVDSPVSNFVKNSNSQFTVVVTFK